MIAGVSRSQFDGVRDDDRVGCQEVAILVQEVRERLRQVLLLALDEQRDAEVEVGAEHFGQRPDCADVRHHARLVVGGPPAVEAVASLRRLERRRIPCLLAPGRLNVVVRVEQHGGAPVAGRAMRDHRGQAQLRVIRSPFCAVDGRSAHVDEIEDAEPAHEFGNGVGRPLHVGRVERGPRDRGDLHEACEVGDGHGESGLDGAAERLDTGVGVV